MKGDKIIMNNFQLLNKQIDQTPLISQAINKMNRLIKMMKFYITTILLLADLKLHRISGQIK